MISTAASKIFNFVMSLGQGNARNSKRQVTGEADQEGQKNWPDIQPKATDHSADLDFDWANGTTKKLLDHEDLPQITQDGDVRDVLLNRVFRNIFRGSRLQRDLTPNQAQELSKHVHLSVEEITERFGTYRATGRHQLEELAKINAELGPPMGKGEFKSMKTLHPAAIREFWQRLEAEKMWEEIKEVYDAKNSGASPKSSQTGTSPSRKRRNETDMLTSMIVGPNGDTVGIVLGKMEARHSKRARNGKTNNIPM